MNKGVLRSFGLLKEVEYSMDSRYREAAFAKCSCLFGFTLRMEEEAKRPKLLCGRRPHVTICVTAAK